MPVQVLKLHSPPEALTFICLFIFKGATASLVEHNDNTDWSYLNCSSLLCLRVYIFNWKYCVFHSSISIELLVNICVEVAELGNKASTSHSIH